MMEDIAVIKSTGIDGAKSHGILVDGDNVPNARTGFSPAIVTLIAEGGVNFLRYLRNLGLPGETNLIVLSSKHHYYYDENDLKSVRILINLRKLNLIKHLDVFLNSLVRILPPNVNFIGYFSDNKNGFQHSRLSKFFHRFNNFLDSRTDRFMNKNEVRTILERNGFEVVNMTKINGLTYFYSHNTGRPVEFKA